MDEHIIYPDKPRYGRWVKTWQTAGNPMRFTVDGITYMAIMDNDILKFVGEQNTETQSTKFSTASSLRGVLG